MSRSALQRAPVGVPADVVAGLDGLPKSLPCKYFYDEVGAALFERICGLPEYYPTRTEIGILRASAGAISRWVGAGARVVEFGSGSGRKTRLLLSALDRPQEYVPVDICSPQLLRSAAALKRAFPGLAVTPVSADYTAPLAYQPSPEVARTICFFPGSSIGNFEPLEAVAFLRRAARSAGPDGGLLIGVDLKKARSVLEPAYNDAAGLTAAFNRNILVHVNALCDAEFNPARFAHVAFYNDRPGRIEMHLRSLARQTVRLGAATEGPALVQLERGELIRTEHSYKYDVEQFRELATHAGWAWRQTWVDSRRWFSVHAFDARN
jgi:L-histidine N-alpha-methyltransferase